MPGARPAGALGGSEAEKRMAAGHVYILVNATMPGYLKIGMTERTPEERARELSQVTGVPVPFNVAYSEDVPDCSAAERLIHSRLDPYRTNQGREFFHLPLRDAIREVAWIAEEIRRSVPAVIPAAAWTPKGVGTPKPPDNDILLGQADSLWQKIGDHWYPVRGRAV